MRATGNAADIRDYSRDEREEHRDGCEHDAEGPGDGDVMTEVSHDRTRSPHEIIGSVIRPIADTSRPIKAATASAWVKRIGRAAWRAAS